MFAVRPTAPRTRAPKAAKEFQKILDHRGIVMSEPIEALAHAAICSLASRAEVLRSSGRNDNCLRIALTAG
jgi:hypothetical protein